MGGPNGMHSGMNHGGMNGQGMHHHPYNNGGRSYFYGYGSPFGFWGYPGYGFYGFGYPWFWYGLGGYGYGYGRGYGYGNNGYYQPVNQFAVAQQGQQMPQAGGGDATEFASAGEAAFKAGDYQMAVKEWRHALVEAPNNGALVLLLAQGLFATGQYDEAAGAVQHAIQTLPQDKWGLVVANYTELYKSNTDFTNQLRALEAAVEKQSTPANQFLLGYQYGYLGYSKQAVRELDKGLKLAPKDDIARKLRAVFAAKLPADQVPAEPAAASSEPEPTTQAVAPESAAPEATGPALTAAEPNTLP
jgi:tetratricopeptide (TPR) repeat protein